MKEQNGKRSICYWINAETTSDLRINSPYKEPRCMSQEKSTHMKKYAIAAQDQCARNTY